MATFVELSLGAGYRLRADAAASYERLADAFFAHFDKDLTISPGGALRDPALQRKVFLERYQPQAAGSGPFGDVRRWNGIRYVRVRGASVAIPGTSVHETGLAADFSANINNYGSPENSWMRANAPSYGWVWPAWAQRSPNFEPWHWEYNPSRDSKKNEKPKSGGLSVANINTILREIKKQGTANQVRAVYVRQREYQEETREMLRQLAEQSKFQFDYGKVADAARRGAEAAIAEGIDVEITATATVREGEDA